MLQISKQPSFFQHLTFDMYNTHNHIIPSKNIIKGSVFQDHSLGYRERLQSFKNHTKLATD